MQIFNLGNIRFSYIINFTKEGGINYDEISSKNG